MDTEYHDEGDDVIAVKEYRECWEADTNSHGLLVVRAADAAIAELEATVEIASELVEVFEGMWADVTDDHVGPGLFAQYGELMACWTERSAP